MVSPGEKTCGSKGASVSGLLKDEKLSKHLGLSDMDFKIMLISSFFRGMRPLVITSMAFHAPVDICEKCGHQDQS